MRVLVDTNVLLRVQNPEAPHHTLAKKALSALRLRDESLCVAAQNLIEFWAVATCKVDENGLGLPIGAAALEIQSLKRLFEVLPSSADAFSEWQRLVSEHAVIGKQTHDAHIAATMLVHDVTHILTFNGKDFARFPGITVIDPNE